MNNSFDLTPFIVSWVEKNNPYSPGEQPQVSGWVKLNTNENPYPPSPLVFDAVRNQLGRLRMYPEPNSMALRKCIAGKHHLKPSQVIIGNGSDNILDMITRSFVGIGQAGNCVPSYSLYPVVVGLSGGDIINIPFDKSMELPVDEILKTPAPVFFITNPNAPTGVYFSLEVIESILKKAKGLIVVDEAYIDFGGQSAAGLVLKYKNLIVVKTFSKSHSLAGLRVGYALADQSIITILDKVRDVYNVDRLAQVGAIAALNDQVHFETNCKKIIDERLKAENKFKDLDWFTYPSKANFLFIMPKDLNGKSGPEVALSLYEFLKSEFILIRYFASHPLTCSFVRVSIGTKDEMEKFFRGIELWHTKEKQK